MTARTYGAKYEDGLNVTEIAKRVRADISDAVKAGTLPKIATSVRISRYSMGQSVSVTVTATPAGFQIHNAARLAATLKNPNGHVEHPWMSDEGRALMNALEAIVDAYNYDGSDSMTDYYDVNFHASVTFGGELSEIHRDVLTLELRAAGKPRVHVVADCVEVAS